MAKQKRSHAVRRRGDSKSHGLAWFLAGAVAGGLVTWVMLGRDPAAESGGGDGWRRRRSSRPA